MYLDMNMDTDPKVESKSYRSYSEFNRESVFSEFDDGTW